MSLGMVKSRPSMRAFSFGRPDKRLRDAGIELPPTKVFHHPDDFTIGKSVYWWRGGRIRRGTVIKVLDSADRPAIVRSVGAFGPHRNYKPSIHDYCDADGNKGLGVKLMQSHSPANLAGLTALYGKGFVGGGLAGPDEYADAQPRPPFYTIADYHVRQRFKSELKKTKIDTDSPWGIYLRAYNVCLAEFTPNSARLRDALAQIFDAAHALKKTKIAEFKRGRQQNDRGQRVHAKRSRGPRRRVRKKK